MQPYEDMTSTATLPEEFVLQSTVTKSLEGVPPTTIVPLVTVHV